MTYEELSEVRHLKKEIQKTQEQIKTLNELIKPASVKFTRETIIKNGVEKSYTCLDTSPRVTSTNSPTEMLAVTISDAERNLAILQKRLSEATPKLVSKIRAEFPDKTEQTLLLCRYVACNHFRDIGFKMGYSENWVYWKHSQILKKIRVD